MQVDLIETFLDLMETRSFNRTASGSTSRNPRFPIG